MKLVSSQEVIEFHDRLVMRDGGVAGMPDPGRADAIIHRVLNMHYYEGIKDVFDLAAVYLVAIARGHIFNDANKRTALFVAQVFLKRNGIGIISSRCAFDEMQEIALNAATGEYTWQKVSEHLKTIILNN
ncbi:TPA: type II toxin-antitoxin system death-on-curing family toxin [Citrobacter freundii]